MTLIYIVAIACATTYLGESYSFTELKKFWSQSCWDELSRDIGSEGDRLTDCFRPLNLSLSESFVQDELINKDLKLPDLIFNPLNYSRVIGLVNESYYHDGVFRSMHTGSESFINTAGLNLALAANILASGSEHVRNMYIKFCMMETNFRPIQTCLLHEIPNVVAAGGYSSSCGAVQLEEVVKGVEQSIINWGLYQDFCKEVFGCSSSPVQDCISEVNNGVDIERSPLFMDIVCLLMPNIDEFSACLTQRTRHCTPDVIEAYSNFAKTVLSRWGRHTDIYKTGIVALCDSISRRCSETGDYRVINELSDRCYLPLYQLDLSLGRPGLGIISSIELLININTLALCDEVEKSQKCISEGSAALPCRVDYLLLMNKVISAPSTYCTALREVRTTGNPFTTSSPTIGRTTPVGSPAITATTSRDSTVRYGTPIATSYPIESEPPIETSFPIETPTKTTSIRQPPGGDSTARPPDTTIQAQPRTPAYTDPRISVQITTGQLTTKKVEEKSGYVTRLCFNYVILLAILLATFM